MRLSGKRLGEATHAHSVATCHLCIVERVIRALHHVVRQAIIRTVGNADRDGDSMVVTRARDDRLCDVLPQPLHQGNRLLDAGVGQDNDELLAAPPPHGVGLAQAVLKAPRDLGKDSAAAFAWFVR